MLDPVEVLADELAALAVGVRDADDLGGSPVKVELASRVNTVRYIESIRVRLSPETKTDTDELGVILPTDNKPGDDVPPPKASWNLAGSLYAYLYMELAQQQIDVIGESQLIGYPTQFPSVSMMNWENDKPNARFWVLKLIKDNFHPGVGQCSERVIHGEIYKARPDVMSVCHHHCPSFMPLLITGADYVPVFHMGAQAGIRPPYWDQHDEFGDTNMLVVKPEEGASLARALGPHWLVLMRRHGVTVVGIGVRHCVFRTIFSAHNALFQTRAMMTGGSIASLTPGETKLAGDLVNKTTGLARSWEYWSMRVAKGGGISLASKKRKPGKLAKKSAKKGKPKRR